MTATNHALPALANDVLIADNAPATADDAIVAHHPMQPYERVIVASLQFAELAPTQPIVATVFRHHQLAMTLNGRRERPARVEHRASIHAVETALQTSHANEELVLATREFVRAMTAASLADAHDPLTIYWHSTVRLIRGSLV